MICFPFASFGVILEKEHLISDRGISMRRAIIGDIAGCFDELERLLDAIGLAIGDEVISVGDMVDRGPKSPEVVRFFMGGYGRRAVKGNHERKHERVFNGLMPANVFGKNQQETMRQFRERGDRLGVSYEDAIRYFFTLPLFLEFPEAIVVHAGLIYGVSWEQQNEKIVTGAGFRPENRRHTTELFNWCASYPRDAKPVIFGHAGIAKAPWSLPQRENLWPIDTGCATGGFLTAVTIPDFRVYQVPGYKH